MPEQHPAIVLLGPTGSGKTPLGALLEQKGLSGRRCAHFDFGQQLRAVAGRSRPDEHVTTEDIQFVRHVLATHALLEHKDLPLARRILDSFLHARRADADTIVVMNGLPRHAGQAEALAARIAVRAVIVLECPPETVRRRIAANTGGDRADRVDDDAAAIERKLRTFTQRTVPLIDYYRQRGAQLVAIPVTAAMTAEEMWERCHEHCR